MSKRISFYEYKIRMNSQEEAEKTLKPLNLGLPVLSDVMDTYLVSNSPNTEKIYEADGKIFYVVVSPTNNGFLMETQEINKQSKEDLIKNRKIERVMKKKRQVWRIDDNIELAIDKVEGLGGVFIEAQGSSQEGVRKLLLSLNIKESQLLTKPYNKFHV